MKKPPSDPAKVTAQTKNKNLKQNLVIRTLIVNKHAQAHFNQPQHRPDQSGRQSHDTWCEVRELRRSAGKHGILPGLVTILYLLADGVVGGFPGRLCDMLC